MCYVTDVILESAYLVTHLITLKAYGNCLFFAFFLLILKMYLPVELLLIYLQMLLSNFV